MILDILGKSHRPMSLNEITAHFTIDRSSVFRLINTLLKCGYVTQQSDTKQYSIGYKVVALAGSHGSSTIITDLIRPVMRRVLSDTRQNTHLAVLESDEVVFVAVEQPNDHLALNITVGSREPAAVTALGRSLLAFQPQDELNGTISGRRLKKYTEKTITSKPALMKALQQVRADRLAFDDEEYRPGIVCLAAPVFDHTGKVRYSIGISGLRDAVRPHQQRYQKIIRQAGIDASKILGYQPTT